jgi:hypothetical protein
VVKTLRVMKQFLPNAPDKRAPCFTRAIKGQPPTARKAPIEGREAGRML